MTFMFNLDEYTTVRERVIEFWKRYPNGRIETEILDWSDKRFIVGARLYREATDDKPFSTGFAHEVITDRGVNKDFALENGVTSAIGVACGHANIGIDKHKPSQEEMKKVVATKVVKPPVQDVKADDQDYWTTPVGEYRGVVDAPVTLDKAMETIAAVMGTGEAQESPSCKHGHMQWREGEKNGKAWGGFMCSVVNHQGGEPKCPALWYVVNNQGKWEPQKARA
jgi:hypothetical protein